MAKYSDLSVGEVQKLAAELARTFSKKPVIIGLSGNLGSGKTTFAKEFAKTLGIKTLKSPTFIISQRYHLKLANFNTKSRRYSLRNSFLYHMDFYRLGKTADLAPLGLTEILESGNTILIEWVEKFPKIKRQCNILINFKIKPKHKRDVTIQTN